MTLHVDGSVVRAVCEQLRPEPMREHWVLVGERRFPPKQVVYAATGIPRTEYNSHQALAALRRCGFQTSAVPPRGGAGSPRPRPSEVLRATPDPERLRAAFEAVVGFLTEAGLTTRVGRLEAEFEGADRTRAASHAETSGLSVDLIHAALLVRQHVGRIDDLIHAAVITRVLPLILEDGERVTRRPSLASGNDASRPFDLETDRRIAEFKVAVWKGADTMRARALTSDFVQLAMAETDRVPELYVVGPRPAHFLATSRMTVWWALGRAAPTLRDRFASRFDKGLTMREFTAGPASHVIVRDLAEILPGLG